MRKVYRLIGLVLIACLALSACAESGGAVNAEPVYMLAQAMAAAERFAGLVVSENAVEITREAGKTIKELYVSEGEDVTEGQKLFSYDSDELQLQLDKQELDMERLDAQIANTEASIKDVQKELAYAGGDTRTQLNIQLRSLQTELTQATYDKASLQTEIDYTKGLLENVDVLSPITGTIRKINEDGNGAYITIQQAGAYRVKGLLNEMNMSAGIMEGVGVKIISRLDENQVWYGTVSKVDYENAEQNSMDSMYYGNSSEMTSSSSYPFYIDLESTEGLLLGQHVFVQIATEPMDPDLVWVPEGYLFDMAFDEISFETTASVWAVSASDTLEKRTVSLGMYDMATGSYEILSGLTNGDYIADPADSGCVQGAKVIRRSAEDFSVPEQPEEDDGNQDISADDVMDETVDEGGLSESEQESLAIEIADAIENGEE